MNWGDGTFSDSVYRCEGCSFSRGSGNYFIEGRVVAVVCSKSRCRVFATGGGVVGGGEVGGLDAASAAVDAHIAVGGLELLLCHLVGADAVGLVLEGDGGGGGGEEAKGEDASIAAGDVSCADGRGGFVACLEKLGEAGEAGEARMKKSWGRRVAVECLTEIRWPWLWFECVTIDVVYVQATKFGDW